MSAALSANQRHVVRAAGRVGVLMGGDSAEREISLRSGAAVTAALREGGIDAVALDWNGRLDADFLAHDVDRYFIALHGRGGEDGQVQAVLDLLGRPYTGSGVLGCALAMDKSRAKLAWLGAGLPTPDFELADEHADAEALIRRLGAPLFVKPAREGSSIGVSKVDNGEALRAAIALARRHDDTVIVERGISGSEYTLSIVDGVALPVIKLETPREFYDYQAKYHADDTRYLCPCGLSSSDEQAAAELGLRAFEVLGGCGWGRVDFMRDAAGRNWLIELNTVPGMTDHSLVPMAAQQAGMSFVDLVLAILGASMREVHGR
ncbi:MAG: D-alanine--D-alanine ligase [Gammaproteobacteria bacterium]|nr:D-alanine--D-alanine ligase [Gammaproteobacteria bacterium]